MKSRNSFIRQLVAAVTCLLFTLMAYGQAVPEEARRSFKERFPQGDLIEWEAFQGTYTAAFFVPSGNYAEAKFHKSGEWMETSILLSENQLPEKVAKRWRKKYPEIRSLSAINKVELPGRNKAEYWISFETSDMLVNLVFNEKGKLKKKNEEPIAKED